MLEPLVSSLPTSLEMRTQFDPKRPRRTKYLASNCVMNWVQATGYHTADWENAKFARPRLKRPCGLQRQQTAAH